VPALRHDRGQNHVATVFGQYGAYTEPANNTGP
jgi:hypothetical protein